MAPWHERRPGTPVRQPRQDLRQSPRCKAAWHQLQGGCRRRPRIATNPQRSAQTAGAGQAPADGAADGPPWVPRCRAVCRAGVAGRRGLSRPGPERRPSSVAMVVPSHSGMPIDFIGRAKSGVLRQGQTAVRQDAPGLAKPGPADNALVARRVPLAAARRPFGVATGPRPTPASRSFNSQARTPAVASRSGADSTRQVGRPADACGPGRQVPHRWPRCWVGFRKWQDRLDAHAPG